MAGDPAADKRAQEQELLTQLALDSVSAIVVSETQGLGFDPIIVGGLMASDLLYQYVLEDILTDRYGQAIVDEMMRSIFLRGILGTVGIWLSTRLAGESIGAVSAAINAFTTYTVSLGLHQAMRSI